MIQYGNSVEYTFSLTLGFPITLKLYDLLYLLV